MTPDTSLPRPSRWLLGRYDYPTSHRVFEVIVVAVFTLLGLLFVGDVVRGIVDAAAWWHLASVPAVVVVAYALSDLLSGLVHLAFDTLGTPDTPIIGQKFVKPFRDHHDDPSAMTHGDAIAVNGDNVFASLLLLVPVWLLVDVRHHPHVGAFMLALVAGIIITNQVHKWCHMAEVPGWVTRAQRRGLILSPEHHDVHHRPPHRSNYCITWGRLDRVVDVFGRRAARRAAVSG